MKSTIARLADGTAVREEPFGYFLAFPDGDMGFYKKSAHSVVRLASAFPVPKAWFVPYKVTSLEDFENFNWDYSLTHPLVVSLEMTLKCNSSCRLCYINAGKPRSNELSIEQHRVLWRQLVEAKVCCVLLTGGEPLLHPQILEVIHFFHSNSVVVSLATNGTLLTKQFVKKLPRSDFGMGISVDSFTNNSKIRGEKSSFKLLEPKIRLLKDEEIPFNMVVTLSKLNIDDVSELIEWCMRNDVMMETLEAQYLGRAISNSHLLLGVQDLPVDAAIYRAKEELEDVYESRHDRSGRFFSGYLQASNEYAMLTKRCNGARSVAYIASDGTLYPCSNCASMGIMSAGNVLDKSFKCLWHESFSEMRLINWEDFKDCRACELSRQPYYCPSRCPALSYAQTKKFTMPGCNPYMRGAVLQRTRIHDEMHAAQSVGFSVRALDAPKDN